MNQAVALLILALQLLNAVSANPNAPADLRTEAVTVANAAIAEANSELAQGNVSPIITSAPVIPATQEQTQNFTPSFGSTMTDTQAPEITIEQQNAPQFLVRDPAGNRPYGIFVYRVRVFDENGNTVQNAPVSMDAPGNVGNEEISATTNTIAGTGSTDYFKDFQYVPQATGTPTLTFTSGDLSATTSVVVQ